MAIISSATLPPELLSHIVTRVDCLRDVSSLARTNRYLYGVLIPELYSLDARSMFPRALVWASLHRQQVALDLALQAGSNVDSIYANITTVDTVSDQSLKIQSIIRFRATSLLCAAAIGDVAIVNRLLEAGANPLRVDEKGQTALHLAAQQGHGDIVAILIQRFPSLLSVKGGSHGNLPVIDAAPHRELFRQMLEAMDPSMCATGLDSAARLGYEDVFHRLLERGVEIDLRRWNDGSNDTLVRVCIGADGSHVRIAEYLLGAGVATDVIYDSDAFESMTALHVVCTTNNVNVLDMARILLDNGADPTTTTTVMGSKMSSLQAACSTGNVDLVKLLLSYISDPAAPYGDEYFDKGYADACRSGNMECVQLIFDRFPPATLDSWLGTRCLSNACKSGDLKLVRMLLDNGATANHLESGLEDGPRDVFGPLCHAWHRGDLELIQMLINAGVTPNKGHYVKRPLFHHSPWPDVSDEMQLACFQLLVSAGADPTLCSPSNGDPLLGACAVGATSCVKLLLDKYGLKIQQQPRPSTRNCLQLAIQRGSIETVKVLLEHGADANSVDALGYRPLHFAMKVADKSKREALIAHLLSYGADVNARARAHGPSAPALCYLIHASKLYRPVIDGLDEPSTALGLLIDHGATDLDLALYMACNTRSYFAAKELLERGANPRAKVAGGLSLSEVRHESLVPPIQLLLSRVDFGKVLA